MAKLSCEAEILQLLQNVFQHERARLSAHRVVLFAHNPYGDGQAASRICDILRCH